MSYCVGLTISPLACIFPALHYHTLLQNPTSPHYSLKDYLADYRLPSASPEGQALNASSWMYKKHLEKLLDYPRPRQALAHQVLDKLSLDSL